MPEHSPTCRRACLEAQKTIASCFGVCCTSVPFLPVCCLRGPRALCASLCVLCCCLVPLLGLGAWRPLWVLLAVVFVVVGLSREFFPITRVRIRLCLAFGWVCVGYLCGGPALALCVGGCVFGVVVACCTEASPKPSLGWVSCSCGTRVVLAYVRGCLHVDSGSKHYSVLLSVVLHWHSLRSAGHWWSHPTLLPALVPFLYSSPRHAMPRTVTWPVCTQVGLGLETMDSSVYPINTAVSPA